MILRITKNYIVLIAATVWLIVWTVGHVWPPSWWLSVRHVIVFDAPVDTPVIMSVDRSIHRPFLADWSVIVRRWDEHGWTVLCAANGGGEYRPNSSLPDPVTLSWWTNGLCTTPPEGQYLISTIWTIQGGMMPDKVVRAESNVFRITSVDVEGDTK